MARGKRISELPPAAAVQADDLFVIARGRKNYRVPASLLSGTAADGPKGGFSFVYEQDSQFGPGLPDSASGKLRWSGALPSSAYAIWIHRQAFSGIDSGSYWPSSGARFLQVSVEGSSATALYELQAVSLLGNVFRLDVEWKSGSIVSAAGNRIVLSPMPVAGGDGLICGYPAPPQQPQDGQALVFDAAAGLWRPQFVSGIQILRFTAQHTDPVFRSAATSVSIPAGILPEGGKVLGVSVRFAIGFSGVPGVEMSVGWQGGLESYMSFVPANAGGHHDVAGFHSAFWPQHELSVVFRAGQPFGNGTSTFLTSGLAELSVAWIAL